jgi:ribosomal protein S1
MSNESNADLTVGMERKGKVKAIELYGAFVDIGTGQDALLHVSQLGKPNVRNVEDVVKAGEEITVYVLKVDKDNGRVALSLVKPPTVAWDDLQVGQSLTGKVTRIEKFGAFIDVGAERPAMIHVSELSDAMSSLPMMSSKSVRSDWARPQD